MLSLIRFRHLLVIVCWLGWVGGASAQHDYRFERLWPNLAQPWYFNFPTGIAADPNEGYLYVADSLNNRVHKLDSHGNYIGSMGSLGEGPLQFKTPVGVAVYGDWIYVLESGNNRVQVLDNAGRYVGSWGKPGEQFGEFKQPQGITIDQWGIVYVADTGNHRIQTFDLQGNFLGYWQGFVDYFQFPSGIALSDNDYGSVMYVADSGNNVIQALYFDGFNYYPWYWGGQGSAEGQFFNPTSIAIEPWTGYLFIVDSGNHRVQIFNPDGNYDGTFGKLGAGGDQFNFPVGIAFVPNDGSLLGYSLVIGDTGNHRLQWLSFNDKNFERLQFQALGAAGVAPGYFTEPGGIAISPQGEIYIADTLNHRIQVFDADGKFLRQWGQFGAQPGQFNVPNSLVYYQDRVYVVDLSNHRVQVFTPQGGFIKQWGGQGSAPGQFNNPQGIAISARGLLYVPDRNNHRVQVFDAEGNFRTAWGNLGTGNGQFNEPRGAAVDAAGRVYIADSLNHRIQVFDSNGKYLGHWGTPGKNPGQLQIPAGMAFAPNGDLLVSELLNHRIQIFTPDGRPLQILGSEGSAPGQFELPFDLAFDPQGALLITDTGNHRIQKFRPSSFVPTPVPNDPTTPISTIKHPYKAVILAGGGPSSGNYINHIWDGTQMLANKAVQALRLQGFAKNEIRYLTAGPTALDLDNNGQFDDLLSASTASLQEAITQWAADAQEVLIYLVDHGGPGRFQITATEILTAEQLNAWITQLKTRTPGNLTVIIEACKSGSFIDSLAQSRRYVMTSADTEQAAVISNNGLNSFSYYFWAEILSGADLRGAFRNARQAMSSQLIAGKPQQALLDSDGDRQFTAADLDALGNYCLGNCVRYAANLPTILQLGGNPTLNGQHEATLSLKASSLEPLVSAWALVQRPDDPVLDPEQPINSLDRVVLTCDTQGQCQGVYKRFDVRGDYAVSFYVQDQKGQVSLPMVATIQQTQGPLPALAVYNDKNGSLKLTAVRAFGQFWQATFQDIGNYRFRLVSAQPLAQAPAVHAVYDDSRRTLTMPDTSALNKRWDVGLQHAGDFIFSVTGASAR